MDGSWKLRRGLVQFCKTHIHSRSVLQGLKTAEAVVDLCRTSVAGVVPSVIRPRPRFLTIAVTSNCNVRCQGCLYGLRQYMPGSKLPIGLVADCLGDAASAGISTVRLYGGEPLLHPDLAEMISICRRLQMTPFITTNGTMLKARIASLVDAGLEILSFGYYGSEACYDQYVGTNGAWRRFADGVAHARSEYGNKLEMHISYLLSTRTSSLQELDSAWHFAKEHSLRFHVDLVHYSLPYFTEGPDRVLQFTPEHRGVIETFVKRLAELKQERPDLYSEPNASIHSIPDWLMKGPDMRVPCDANNMIWVGADGSVRLCFVTFPLGNLYENRLCDMLFTRAHKDACQKAAQLDCPNCHCSRDTRVMKHLPSRLKYSSNKSV